VRYKGILSPEEEYDLPFDSDQAFQSQKNCFFQKTLVEKDFLAGSAFQFSNVSALFSHSFLRWPAKREIGQPLTSFFLLLLLVRACLKKDHLTLAKSRTDSTRKRNVKRKKSHRETID